MSTTKKPKTTPKKRVKKQAETTAASFVRLATEARVISENLKHHSWQVAEAFDKFSHALNREARFIRHKH